MDIQNVINALQHYHQSMVESDPTVQELHAEVGRLKQELSDSTNHYNGVINDLVKLRDEARVELEQLKADYDSSNKALYEQIRVQKSISDAHHENYCEMLKRVDAVARERDKASEEVKRLTSALCNSNAQQLDQALHERDEARDEVERVKKALHDALAEISRLEKMTPVISRAATRTEPSRLEIAAMLMAGCYANPEADNYATEKKWWIEQADALIAAAKEVTK